MQIFIIWLCKCSRLTTLGIRTTILDPPSAAAPQRTHPKHTHTHTHTATEASAGKRAKRTVSWPWLPTAGKFEFRWRFQFFAFFVEGRRGEAENAVATEGATVEHCHMWLEILNLFATPSSVSVSFCRVRPPFLRPYPLPLLTLLPLVALVVCVFIFSHVLLCYCHSSCVPHSLLLPSSLSVCLLSRDLNLLSEILLKSLYAWLTVALGEKLGKGFHWGKTHLNWYTTLSRVARQVTQSRLKLYSCW